MKFVVWVKKTIIALTIRTIIPAITVVIHGSIAHSSLRISVYSKEAVMDLHINSQIHCNRISPPQTLP